jgi:hemolysin activation/secretion protein
VAGSAAEVGRAIDFQDPAAPNYVAPRLDRSSATPAPSIELPDLPKVAPGSEAQATGFELITIEVRGCTVFTKSELDELAAPWLGRRIAAEDVNGLRLTINRAYLERGYINSGVRVPPQDVGSGTLVFEAIEGNLPAIAFDTTMHTDPRYVEARLNRHLSNPLNLGDLQTALHHLERDANIERIDARLVPGEQPGESRLALEVDERKRFEIGIGADNHRSPSVGENRGRVSARLANLTGWGESLRLSYTIADEGDEAAGSFSVPLGSGGTAVSAYGGRSDARIVEKDFEVLDIESLTTTWGISFDHRLIDRLDETLTASLGFEAKRSETRLLGLPFSFSPGAQDGISRTRPLLVGLDWVERGPDHVLGLRATWRRGLDVGAATTFDPDTEIEVLLNPTGADGDFSLGLFQGIYIHRLNRLPGFRWSDDRGQVLVRTTAQIASDPLMSLEKIAIGGVETVRGYRENLLVRDNGLAATLEFQIPIPGYRADPHWRNLMIAPFIDWGRSWDEQNTDQTSPTRDTTNRRWILGIGVGILWEPVEGLRAALYWGDAAADNFDGDDPSDTDGDDGLQGDGIHYSVNWTYRF